MLYKMGLSLLGMIALCFGAFGATEGVDDVIRLQKSAVGDDVLTAFVDNSELAYDLSADDIQLLEDANVSSSVIVTMLDHGKKMRSEQAALPVSPASPPVATEPAPVESAVVYAPPPDQADISFFYQALSPYGTWIQDPGVGWVWEPTDGVRDINWRPYANNGHWVWTDYGWYWESDAPYGWATYHYGRWGYNSRHRWSWAPDNVWGPAWVDWRQTDDYYGWAPLPFGSRYHSGIGFSVNGDNVGFDFRLSMNESYYNFVPSRSFLDLNLVIAFEPERRRHDHYSQSRVVHNSYEHSNDRIFNRGVSTKDVEHATRRSIERVSVVDVNIAAGQPIRGERRTGNRIEAYRPKVASVASVEPPVAVARQKEEAKRRGDNRDDLRSGKVDRIGDGNSGQGDDLHKAAREQDARRRLTEEKQRGDNRDDLRSGKVDRIGDGNSGQGDDLHKAEKEQDARRRVAEEKARLKDKKANPSVETRGPADRSSAPKVDASYIKEQAARNEAASERKAATEAEKQASERVREAKGAADAREKASEQRNANDKAAGERKEAATEANRQAGEKVREAKAAAEAREKASEQRQPSKPEAQPHSANREAAPERNTAAEAAKEPKQNAGEEQRGANKEAVNERKDAAEAQNETKREERDADKAEKTHGRK